MFPATTQASKDTPGEEGKTGKRKDRERERERERKREREREGGEREGGRKRRSSCFWLKVQVQE